MSGAMRRASRKPPLMIQLRPEADEAEIARLRERLAETLARDWLRKTTIVPPGPEVTRMNLWQRARYRLAKWIMP